MICHEMDGVIDSYHSDHCQIYERKCEEFHQSIRIRSNRPGVCGSGSKF
jgi:hypothetical protein